MTSSLDPENRAVRLHLADSDGDPNEWTSAIVDRGVQCAEVAWPSVLRAPQHGPRVPTISIGSSKTLYSGFYSPVMGRPSLPL